MKKTSALLLALWLTLQSTLPVMATNTPIKEIDDLVYARIEIGQFFPVNGRPAIKYYQRVISANQYEGVEYKQPKEDFIDTVKSIRTNVVIEELYLTNENKELDYSPTNSGTDNISLEPITNIKTPYSAYNFNKLEPNNQLNLTQSQWLLNNGIVTRFNDYIKINKGNLDVSPLSRTPWGNIDNQQYITRDEFLVSIMKSVYGEIPSRPYAFEIDSFRYAKRVIWKKVYDDKGNLIGYKYSEGPGSVQDVSTNNSYETSAESFRNEYVILNDEYHTELRYNLNKDLILFQSTNVYELYLLKALEKGVLDPAEIFAKQESTDFLTEGTIDSYLFSSDIKANLQAELLNWGKSNSFPTYAPELGYSLNGSTASNLDKNLSAKGTTSVLGRNYKVASNGNIEFLGDTQTNRPTQEYFQYQSLSTISAFRLIEKVLRVEEQDMTELEASIITKKYSAKYLDEITDTKDRKTVEYLIAKGIIDFENPDEYKAIYNILDRGYGYTLIYRLANENARTTFSQIQLTDSSSLLDTFIGYNEYQNDIKTLNNNVLSSILQGNELVKDKSITAKSVSTSTTENNSLDLNSNVQLVTVRDSSNGNPIKVLTLSFDDIHKYGYINAPIIMYDNSVKPIITTTNPWGKIYDKLSERTYYKIAHRNLIGSRQVNAIPEIVKVEEAQSTNYIPSNFRSTDQDPSGILAIYQDNKTSRWYAEISVIAPNVDTAFQAVKSNLIVLSDGLFESKQEISYENSKGINMMTDTSKLSNEIMVGTNVTSDNNTLGVSNYSSGISVVSSHILPGVIDRTTSGLLTPEPIAMLGSNGQYYKSNVGDKSAYILSDIVQKGSHGTIGNTEIQVNKYKTVEGEKEFINISNNSYSPTYIKEDLVSVPVIKDKSREQEMISIPVTYIVEYNIDLPDLEEQNLLYNAYTTDPNIYYKSWFYTKPEEEDSLQLWNYNQGISKSLNSFLGVQPVTSGYLYPSVTILYDFENLNTGGDTDNTKNISTYLENKFYNDMGSHLDKEWVNTYVGTLDYALSKPKSTKIDFKGTVDLNSAQTFNNQLAVWANLVFNYKQMNSKDLQTFLNRRLVNPSLNISYIVGYDGGSTIYGNNVKEQTDLSVLNNTYTYEFIKDNQGGYYQDIKKSLFSYKNNKLNIEPLSYEPVTVINNEYIIDGETYILKKETDLSYQLMSKKLYIFNKLEDGFVSVENGLSIADYFQTLGDNSFGNKAPQNTRRSDLFSLDAFNYFIDPKLKNDTTYNSFLELHDGVYKVVNNIGDTVHVNETMSIVAPMTITIPKTYWVLEGSYIKQTNRLLGAQSQLINLPDIKALMVQTTASLSDDIISTDNLNNTYIKSEQGDIFIQDSYGYFSVPFDSSFFKDEMVDIYAIDNKMLAQSMQVTTGENKFASTLDYFGKTEVAEYNPDNIDVYDRTLVLKNGKYVVATKETVSNLTDASIINNVAIRKKIDTALDIISIVGSNGVSEYQTVSSVQTMSPRNRYNTEVNNIYYTSESISSDALGIKIISEPMGSQSIFNKLLNSAKELRAEAATLKFIYLFTTLGAFYSMFIVLLRLLRSIPLVIAIVENAESKTGYDLFQFLSIGIITLDKETSWVKTFAYSLLFFILPYLFLMIYNTVNTV